jgi:hypothetical protein
MVGQLNLERPLNQPLRQLREHTTRPDDLLLRTGAREQLINDRVGQPALQIIRHAIKAASKPGPNEPDLSARRTRRKLTNRILLL